MQRNEDESDECKLKGNTRIAHGRWRHVLAGDLAFDTLSLDCTSWIKPVARVAPHPNATIRWASGAAGRFAPPGRRSFGVNSG